MIKRVLGMIFMAMFCVVILEVPTYAAETQQKENESAYNYVMVTGSYLKEGAIYYENAALEGRHNVVDEYNPFIDDNRRIVINGYAVVDEDIQVVAKDYQKTDIDLEFPEFPVNCELRFHVKSILKDKEHDLGWVTKDDIGRSMDWINSTTKASRALKTLENDFELDNKEGKKAVLVLDCSKKMEKHSKLVYMGFWEFLPEKIALYLSTDESREDIVLGKNVDNFINGNGENSMHMSLKKAVEKNPDAHIYVVADVQPVGRSWKQDEQFEGKITFLQFGKDNCKLFSQIYPNAESITIKYLD